MTRPSVICEPWHVVIVPFPFTDRRATKKRPALVLSQKTFNRNGHTILAMITSAAHAPWPGDVHVTDLAAAGLTRPCLVRFKLFTLDNRFIERPTGRLAGADRLQVVAALTMHIAVSG